MTTEGPAQPAPRSMANPAPFRDGWFARLLNKNWDRHVSHTVELAATPAFRQLREEILRRAAPETNDRALDVGTGTGLLALPLGRRCRSVWAVDISPAMIEFVGERAREADLISVRPLVATATSIPLPDEHFHLVVSNYCFHHLRRSEKRKAMSELYRLLAPGGRLVFADMMFGWRPAHPRDRKIVVSKVSALGRRGPAGMLRLARAAFRSVGLRGEHPAPPEWWAGALSQAGFVDITVEPLRFESGIAVARKPR